LLGPEVIKIMETNADVAVPLKVQVTVGRNWLDQVDYPAAK
jgi:DNA polymerase-1